MSEDNPWISMMDEMPPYDIIVETKGGYVGGHIVKDVFSSTLGDWTRQPGDPTHWRPIKFEQLSERENPKTLP